MNHPAIAHRLEPARDTLARPLHDLRISVIDRCNFRCPYCMPEDQYAQDHVFLGKDQRLRFEEIERIARAFVALGVRKLRLTGGEPLLRRDLDTLIRMLVAETGIDDIALTT
ncbi:MAG TPA: radical SAM protein, partial [Rudaea sp.]